MDTYRCDHAPLTENLSIGRLASRAEGSRVSDPATLLYLIKNLELAVRAALDHALAPTGLTPVQFTALTVLEHHPAMTAAALARNSFVRPQTAAHLVGALEAQGLIERRTDPDSRRQSLISLTEAGILLLASLRGPVEAVEDRMMRSLEPGDRPEFARLLRACRAGLEGRDAPTSPAKD